MLVAAVIRAAGGAGMVSSFNSSMRATDLGDAASRMESMTVCVIPAGMCGPMPSSRTKNVVMDIGSVGLAG